MGRRAAGVVLFALVAAGCGGADPDQDGLTNDEELAAGTDPKVADTDGDGLADGDEVDRGIDPLAADTDGDGLADGDEIASGADPKLVDTDGDGYTDRDEVHESKDPADPDSVIYRGGWPYVYDKDAIEPGPAAAKKGERFLRLSLKDQYGDKVDLFDFYNADKPVVIDISAQWCSPCRDLAAYLDGQSEAMGFAEMWPSGPEVVDAGDVYWITILGQNALHEPATKPTATEWADQFPAERVVVLADGDQTAPDFVGLTEWPTVLLLEPDLTISRDVDEWWAEFVLPVLEERYPSAR